MKKSILLLPSLLMIGFAFGQNCSDLIVSEIVFGKQGSSLLGEATYFNHSVEIFNPTDSPIDLGEYEIVLVPEDGEKTTVELLGVIPPEGVFVISHTAINPAIDAVTDMLDSLLFFEGMVAIELTKEGTVIDKIGRKGIGVTVSTIDLDALLNDPDYLNSLEINLGSIENLTIRRKRVVQKGNEDFVNEDLLKEWMIYPSFEISDLGYHFNACNQPMILWADIKQFEWEFELVESDGAIPPDPPFVWASGTILLTEALSEDLVFSIFADNHEYFPMDDPASFDDWGSIDIAQDFIIQAGQTTFDFPMLAWAIVDATPENPEGFGLKVNAAFGGAAIADPDNDVLDIRIIEPFTKTKDQKRLEASLSVYPVIASEYLFVQSEDLGIKIEAIKIYSIDGRFVRKYAYENGQYGNIKLDFKNFTGTGYHLLVVKTNKGIVTKKFFAINW